MSGFISANLTVERALEEEREFDTEAELEEWTRTLQAQAEAEGWCGEVFVIRHPHDSRAPCSCVQYEQDHHPYRVIDAGFDPQKEE